MYFFLISRRKKKNNDSYNTSDGNIFSKINFKLLRVRFCLKLTYIIFCVQAIYCKYIIFK